ncbi:FtsX-like permease family protein [Candidatus Lokiarchaeum ossiferum]|uniref:FtsX-like permease family protein n=1 Tax=Candidatus Lokiarchaeum ossiferum TaxID=2951803 RepID=UPI00352FB505
MSNFSSLASIKDKISIPTLVGVVISISMFAGLNFFFEASQKANFNEAFTNCNDIEIYHEHEIWYDGGGGRHCFPNLQFTETFKATDSKVNSLIKNSSLKISNVSKSASIVFDKGYLVIDQYNLTGCENAMSKEEYLLLMNSTITGFEFFESNFYQTDTFHGCFKVIEGETPKNSSQCLIDYTTALKLGLKVGECHNIIMREGSIWKNPLLNFPVNTMLRDYLIENITICGIYLPKSYKTQFNEEFYKFSYNYEDYQSGKNYSQTFIENPVIFCWSNFSMQGQNSPAHFLIESMMKDPENFQWRTGRFFINGATGTAYTYLYERGTLDYQNINQDSKQIYMQIYNISNHLPFYTGIRSYVEFTMRQFLTDMQDFRTKLFYMSLPMMISTILIGSSFQKSIEKKRLNELFLLRCKGMSKKNIRSVIATEGLIFILISWVLGIILGCVFFYLYYFFMGDLFLTNNYGNFMVPSISSTPLIISGIICSLEVALIYFPLWKKIKNQHFNELNLALNSPFADSEEHFDEVQHKIDVSLRKNRTNKKIFTSKSKKNSFQNDLNHHPKNDSTSNQTPKDLGLENEMGFQLPRIKPLLLKSIKFLAIVFLPLIFCLLTVLSYFIPIPDQFSTFSHYFKSNSFILELIMMSSLVLITVNFSRIIFQENPSIFIRIVRCISHLFVKDYDNLISLELVGKRKWVNYLILVSSFTGLVVLTNFMMQNNLKILTILENFLNLTYNVGLDELPGDNIFDSFNFYQLFFRFLVVSSFFIIIESALLQILLYKENHILNQSLSIRGLTNSTLYKILFFESVIVFIFGIVIGYIVGIGFGLLLSFINFLKWQLEYFQHLEMTVSFESCIGLENGNILLLLLSIFILSISLFFIYVINRRKLTPRPNEL